MKNVLLLKPLILIALSLAFLKPYSQVLSVSQTTSTVINDNVPGAKSSWINPTNATTSNNVFTTAHVQNKRHSDMLVATNWGFVVGNGANQIPASAVINGFEVEIKMQGSSKGVRDNDIRLRKNNSISSANLARANTAWPQTASYVKFGSSTNMWGLSWTAAEIAASTFGVEISVEGKGTPGDAMIDHIRITVYYNLRFYYSKSADNLTSLATWGPNLDGSGVAPPNFSDSGQIFTLRNRAATTLDGNLTLSGEATKMIVGDGTNPTALTIPSSAVLTSLVDVRPNGTLNIANTVSPTLGDLETNSTVNFNATTNQTVQDLTYYHLILGGTGTKTSLVTGNSITVNGNFTINGGITFHNDDQDVGVNGNFINSGTTTGSAFIYMGGLAASTISGTNGVIRNLKTENDISVTLSSSQTITDTLYLADFPFTTGAFLNMSTGALLIRDEGTISASPTSNNLYDIQYVGVTKTAGPEIASSFIRNMKLSLVDTLPNTLTLSQALTLNGYLQLDSGTLDASTSNYNISVFKNIIANSTLNNRSNTCTLNGNTLQTISGTASINFYRLSINNSSAAGIQLLTPVQISNLLTFSNGIITTSSTNTLTLGSTATTTGSASNKYINGPLSKTLATSTLTSFVYPIGSSTLYRPVTLEIDQAATTATTYTVEMMNGAPPAATLPGSLTSVSAYRYYKVTKGAGSAVTNAFITLNYAAEDNTISAPSTRLAMRNGANWVDLGGTGNTWPSGSIRSTVNFTTFTDFVLADNTGALPVSIVSFKGVLNNGIAKLQWITGTEINVDHYEIEKSANGNNWSVIGTLQSNAGSQLQNTYTANDNNPFSGMNYYRLKIVDKNRTYTFSKVISISNSNVVAPKVAMWPNVISNKQSTVVADGFSYSPNEIIVLKVYNANGTLVQKKTATAQNKIPLNLTGLPSGKYTLSTQIKGQTYTSSFVIQ